MYDNAELLEYLESLKQEIKNSYEEGVSPEVAERLAAKFLDASMAVGDALKVVDLDRRMRKSGVKAIKAAVYLEAASKGDKKPSDKMLEAIVDSDKIVNEQQKSFDESEVIFNNFQNYLSVFHEAHIYYRGVAKGRFE